MNCHGLVGLQTVGGRLRGKDAAGAEFDRSLRISNGSRQEVQSQLFIANRLGYIAEDWLGPLSEQIEELGRIINGLRNSVHAP